MSSNIKALGHTLGHLAYPARQSAQIVPLSPLAPSAIEPPLPTLPPRPRADAFPVTALSHPLTMPADIQRQVQSSKRLQRLCNLIALHGADVQRAWAKVPPDRYVSRPGDTMGFIRTHPSAVQKLAEAYFARKGPYRAGMSAARDFNDFDKVGQAAELIAMAEYLQYCGRVYHADTFSRLQQLVQIFPERGLSMVRLGAILGNIFGEPDVFYDKLLEAYTGDRFIEVVQYLLAPMQALADAQDGAGLQQVQKEYRGETHEDVYDNFLKRAANLVDTVTFYDESWVAKNPTEAPRVAYALRTVARVHSSSRFPFIRSQSFSEAFGTYPQSPNAFDPRVNRPRRATM